MCVTKTRRDPWPQHVVGINTRCEKKRESEGRIKEGVGKEEGGRRRKAGERREEGERKEKDEREEKEGKKDEGEGRAKKG